MDFQDLKRRIFKSSINQGNLLLLLLPSVKDNVTEETTIAAFNESIRDSLEMKYLDPQT